MKIVTNNVPRTMKYGYEMPEKFRADFDYIDADDFDLHGFIVYKGQWYDSDEFMRVENNSELIGWDGYTSDSYFSGVLIRLVDSDHVIIGRYYS